MKVYIEYVILNNLVANFMILYLVSSVLRRKTHWWLMLVSSIIGTVYAVFLPYIAFEYDIFIKVLLSIIMVAVAFRHSGVREYFSSLIAFYMATFLLGGTIIGIGNIFHYDLANLLLYPNSYYPSIMSLGVIVITYITRLIMRLYHLHKVSSGFYYDVTISYQNHTINTRGYLDSGNRLYYHMSPVIIFDTDLFNKIYGNNVINQNEKYINILTINNNTRVKVYKIDKVTLTKDNSIREFRGVYAIQSTRKFRDYHILLHSDMY